MNDGFQSMSGLFGVLFFLLGSFLLRCFLLRYFLFRYLLLCGFLLRHSGTSLKYIFTCGLIP